MGNDAINPENCGKLNYATLVAAQFLSHLPLLPAMRAASYSWKLVDILINAQVLQYVRSHVIYHGTLHINFILHFSIHDPLLLSILIEKRVVLTGFF